jgi:outer membrane protein assembly factor BamA
MQKTSQYIYIIFFLFSFEALFGQEVSLKLSSENNTEMIILSKIDYKEKHKDTLSLYLEIDKVSNYLKNIGYFLNVIHKVKKENKDYIAYFSLNNKIENVVINIDSKLEIHFEKSKIKKGKVTIPIDKLEFTLSKISRKLDKEGKSFSKVQLKNILIKNKNMFADLQIYQSKKRTINNVIIKGYKNFPKSYIKNYFNIKNNTVFNQQKIKEISEGSQGLKFVTEIKPPEVLFTKDSTSIYIYLKKEQNNSFDGLINFTTKEDGGILFNGNIDLKLNNILNKGEKFSLFWNSIAEERQEFKLSTQIPYIFVSKFSPQLSFSIYKQDSTFINTKFDSKIFYNINPKAKLAITYNSESSESLKQDINNNNIETFSNHFLGLQLQYNLPNKKFFDNNQLYLELEPSIGKRKIRDISSNQYKMEASISFNWNLNRRSSMFIKNKTGYLNSDTYIYNELFRIGGANTIRGFNEQSIFTSSYSFFNIEYRFHTATDAFLYSITDFALISTTNHKEKLIGLGIGYLFTSKNAQINISTAVGSSPSTQLNFKNTQFFVNWVNFF